MSTHAHKLLILVLASAPFAAVLTARESRQVPAMPAATFSEIAPAAASCGAPPPVVPQRRPRPEEEGCSETPPSPALARR